MKRIGSALLALALVMSMAVSGVSAAAVKYGDVNSDGRINNRDLGVLQQYLGEWDVTIDATAADVTADGRVNNRDLGRLQQYLAEWDVQLGPDLPAVELPQVGYDLDGKGRVFVESIALDGNVVTVTIVNNGTKFITEETSYVQYTCTDANGNELFTNDKYYGTLYFGMLELGQSVTKTIVLPEGTTKMVFGASKIVYWTPWS